MPGSSQHNSDIVLHGGAVQVCVFEELLQVARLVVEARPSQERLRQTHQGDGAPRVEGTQSGQSHTIHFISLCLSFSLIFSLYLSLFLSICILHLILLSLCLSRSSQCSTTGVTKAVVCIILSVGWCI